MIVPSLAAILALASRVLALPHCQSILNSLLYIHGVRLSLPGTWHSRHPAAGMVHDHSDEMEGLPNEEIPRKFVSAVREDTS